MNFSKVWNHKGIAIPLNDVHIDFAVDFANIVLKSFVLQCAAQVEAAIKAQQERQAQVPQEHKGHVILEG